MDLIIRWFEQTTLYQGFLAKLPSPLNNVYFDVLVIGALLIYIIYCIISRIVDAVAFARLRKRGQESGENSEGKQELGNEVGNRYLAEGSGASLPEPVLERIEDMNQQFEEFRKDREEEISRLQSRLDEVQAGDSERKQEVEQAIEELRAQIEDLKEVKEKETAELKEKAEEVEAVPKDEDEKQGVVDLEGKQAPRPEGLGASLPNCDAEADTGVEAAFPVSESTQAAENQAEQGISDFDRLLLEYEKTNKLIAEIEGRGKEKAEVSEGETGTPTNEGTEPSDCGGEPVPLSRAVDGSQLPEAILEGKQAPRESSGASLPSQGAKKSPKISNEKVAHAITSATGCADAKELYDMAEKQKIAAVQAALAAGASIRQIADITGISRSGVQRLSKKESA